MKFKIKRGSKVMKRDKLPKSQFKKQATYLIVIIQYSSREYWNRPNRMGKIERT
jgi:hypothetical protein